MFEENCVAANFRTVPWYEIVFSFHDVRYLCHQLWSLRDISFIDVISVLFCFYLGGRMESGPIVRVKNSSNLHAKFPTTLKQSF